MLSSLFLAAAAAPKPPKWGLFVTANNAVSSIIFGIAVILLVGYTISRARAGHTLPAIRRIAGLDAFEEAVGRATEMGKPVHMTDYSTDLGDDATMAYWSYLAYVSKLCAQYDTRIVVSDADYFVNGVNQEIVKQAYLEAGKPDAFNQDDIRFITGSQFAWAMSVAGYLGREKPAAQFLIGYFYAESLILAEAGNAVGAIQVACTVSTTQTAFFVAACDYVMLGEELYAGAAYLSKDPIITGTVVAEDVLRVVLYAVVVFGAIWQTFAPKTNIFYKALMF